jgi:hypothetical protein
MIVARLWGQEIPCTLDEYRDYPLLTTESARPDCPRTRRALVTIHSDVTDAEGACLFPAGAQLDLYAGKLFVTREIP